MAKTIIIFETKYGNTRIIAENIALGMRKVAGNDVKVSDVDDIDINGLGEFDNIVIGSPGYRERATRKIGSLINKVKTSDLQGKTVSFFNTYLPDQYQKAVEKLEAMAAKVPSIRAKPGLSVKIEDEQSEVAEEELTRCVEHGVKLGKDIIETPPSA